MIGSVVLMDPKIGIVRNTLLIRGVWIVRGQFVKGGLRENEAAPNRGSRLIGEREGGPSCERCGSHSLTTSYGPYGPTMAIGNSVTPDGAMLTGDCWPLVSSFTRSDT